MFLFLYLFNQERILHSLENYRMNIFPQILLPLMPFFRANYFTGFIYFSLYLHICEYYACTSRYWFMHFQSYLLFSVLIGEIYHIYKTQYIYSLLFLKIAMIVSVLPLVITKTSNQILLCLLLLHLLWTKIYHIPVIFWAINFAFYFIESHIYSEAFLKFVTYVPNSDASSLILSPRWDLRSTFSLFVDPYFWNFICNPWYMRFFENTLR